MGFMYYAKLNTLKLLGGCTSQTPCFRDTIPGLAPLLKIRPYKQPLKVLH